MGKTKGGGRHAVTLRFSTQDIQIMEAVFMKLAGHKDIKKGCKDIIVNVMQNAIKEIQEVAKAQAAAQEEKAREQGGRDSGGDTQAAQLDASVDSSGQTDNKDNMDDSKGS